MAKDRTNNLATLITLIKCGTDVTWREAGLYGMTRETNSKEKWSAIDNTQRKMSIRTRIRRCCKERENRIKKELVGQRLSLSW